jgi:hypothetical protein
MKKAFGIALLIIGLLIVPAMYGAGNHGKIMFRPHMTQDWIIWGISVVLFMTGLALVAKALRSKRN